MACMMHASYLSYSIKSYMELKVLQGNSILTLYILQSQNSDPWRGIAYSQIKKRMCVEFIVDNPNHILLFDECLSSSRTLMVCKRWYGLSFLLLFFFFLLLDTCPFFQYFILHSHISPFYN